MLKVIYSRDGMEDLRYFSSEEDFLEWYLRQMKLCPETKILSKEEEEP